jgi:hypothetical protein
VARDVEFNLTASDKTGPALSKAEQAFAKTQAKIKKDGEESLGGLGKSLINVAEKVSPKLAQSVTQALASAGSAGAPLLVAGIAAAAPVLGGLVSAAIIGGAGIGGVIGGVVIASKDPRVQAAGKQLGANITSDLKDFAAPFITPVLGGIRQIDAGFDQVGGNLRNIFANSSRFVQPLVTGVVAFAQGAIRGIDALVDRAEPVIDSISQGFEQLGGDVEEFFTEISTGSEGAADAVDALFDLFSAVLGVLGPVISGLSKINGWLDALGLNQGLLQVVDKLRNTGTMTSAVAGEQSNLAGALATTQTAAANQAETLELLAEAQRQLVQDNVSLYDSETKVAGAIAQATKAISSNGQGLAKNTERGRENRETLGGLANALNSNYNAYVKVNGAGEGANAVLRRNRDAFVKVATQATGSAAAAGRLADKLIGIPSVKPKVELLDRASGKINNVINRLSAVKSKTVSVNVLVRQSGDAAALRKQSLPAFSATQHFAATTGDAGVSRVGGPTPVQVAQTLNVSLDGTPFYAYTARAVDEAARRDRWRRKVAYA